ncbi:N(2)-fixation sustaining protein CowN [Thiorhodococcus mannitoliphagus]|uniref:N(2)-fixation sustaining protein CowN n=1 Tax=Thiorhodococcus mannitoliphagus TaxID=329406 RepID=A0A6P1DUW7_9GAMM|nr:N(2)-fixation sustaining protein CowN [Thiorhodococcus mannitoliphagus]
MPCTAAKTDRYISFDGIDCDAYAERILGYIRACIDDAENPSDWQPYFERKLVEIAGMGQDALFFVGSQVNYIRELFEHYDHDDGLELLDKIEDECC